MDAIRKIFTFPCVKKVDDPEPNNIRNIDRLVKDIFFYLAQPVVFTFKACNKLKPGVAPLVFISVGINSICTHLFANHQKVLWVSRICIASYFIHRLFPPFLESSAKFHY